MAGVLISCLCCLLIGEIEAKLTKAKAEITKRAEVFAERQRDLVSSRLLQTMDEASLGEMNDNTWLLKQVCYSDNLTLY